MGLTLYNTMTRRKEDFRPLTAGEVRMYNCGPTVYDFAHIGNFRAYVFSDLLRRYLEYAGFTVYQVMNITDVGHMTTDTDEGEDKLEVGARKEKLDPWELAEKYADAFFQDRDHLKILPAQEYPRATEYVPQMIKMIEKLIKNGFAYEVNGCVYYDVTKFANYGRLSGNTLENLEAGKRIEINPDKRNPWDFVLWVTNDKHIMQWDSPWGSGYPGWHIECSAMSTDLLGDTFDIHTGGEDNIFPHHECEIAQTEGATGKPFVRYWLHTRFLRVDGRKMSKSLGNFYTLRDLIDKGYDPIDIRFVLLATHYRQQLNFTLDGIDAARESRRRLTDFAGNMSRVTKADPCGEVGAHIKKVNSAFAEALDDDLNISAALGAIFDFVHEVNRLWPGQEEARLAAETITGFDRVLGILEEEKSIPAEVMALIEARQKARDAKDFEGADKARDELATMGYTVEDTTEGPVPKKL